MKLPADLLATRALTLILGRNKTHLASFTANVITSGLAGTSAILWYAMVANPPDIAADRAEFIIALPGLRPNELLAWLTEPLIGKTIFLTETEPEPTEIRFLKEAGVAWMLWNHHIGQSVMAGQAEIWTASIRVEMLRSIIARHGGIEKMGANLIAQWEDLLKI